MQLTVLAVPGCPNAPVLEDRLAAVLDGRAGVWVSLQVVSEEGETAGWGMHGSPTLLIDGVDPFAEPGQAPGMSCRLYRDENGQLSGAPSVGQLRQAIGQALAAAGQPRGPGVAGFAGTRWPGPCRARRPRPASRASGRAAIIRAHRDCARHAQPGQARRAVRGVASAGRAGRRRLRVPRSGRPAHGRLPVLAVPTRHRVQISDEAAVFAMRDRRPGHLCDDRPSCRDRIGRSVHRRAGHRAR